MTATHTAHPDRGHAHGTGGGHIAIPHGAQVYYLHDGHRHAAHDDHYDEH